MWWVPKPQTWFLGPARPHHANSHIRQKVSVEVTHGMVGAPVWFPCTRTFCQITQNCRLGQVYSSADRNCRAHSHTSTHTLTDQSSFSHTPFLTHSKTSPHKSHTIPHTLTHQSSHSHTPALTHSHTSPHTVTHQASPHTLTHQTSPHTLTHQASPHKCIKQTPVHYLDIRICQHTYWIQPQNLQSSACVTKIWRTTVAGPLAKEWIKLRTKNTKSVALAKTPESAKTMTKTLESAKQRPRLQNRVGNYNQYFIIWKDNDKESQNMQS